MVEFVNKLTHSRMWVAENRVSEYLAAGHKLAADADAHKTEAVKPAQAAEAKDAQKAEPKKTQAKSSAKTKPKTAAKKGTRK